MTPVLIIAAVVFLLTLWRREYGLAVVILSWPTYLVRTSIHGIPTTALELAVYALLAGAIIHLFIERRPARPKIPFLILVLIGLWVAAWALATLFSTDSQASLGALKAWLIDPFIFGCILLTTVRGVHQRTVILSAAALSGAVVATAGLAQLAWFRQTLQDNRLSSFFHPVANYAAMYLGPLLVLTVGAVRWKLLPRWWWMAAGLMAVAVALTVSFGGYLAVGVGLLMLWWKWPDKKIQRRVLVAGIIVASLGLLALSQTRYLSEKFTSSDRSSSLVRSQIWRTSVEMIKDRPLFGVGPNAYEKIYRATIPKLYFPPLEWLVSQPHQLYLALWLETGLLGLLTFLALIIFWIRWLWPRAKSGEGLAIISLATMLTILVHGFVDTPMFKNDLMMVFAMVLVLPWLDNREP